VAFAAAADVTAALGRSLTSAESGVVNNLLDQADDLIIGYGINPAIDPVPGAVKRVAATMVVAVFTKPSVTVADYDASGYRSSPETAAVHIGNEPGTTQGPWLTNALKMRLSPYRTGGMNQIAMQSESDNSSLVWPDFEELYGS
jgi:cell wall-associated NlpC family hydrolase